MSERKEIEDLTAEEIAAISQPAEAWPTILYRAACSGLLYATPEACGEVNQIRIGDRCWDVADKSQLDALKEQNDHLTRERHRYATELAQLSTYMQTRHPIGQVKHIGLMEAVEAVRQYVGELESQLAQLRTENERLTKERDALQAFKQYVHDRLDAAGIPTHPDGPHSKEGCRVGDRLDIAMPKSPARQMAERIIEKPEMLDGIIEAVSSDEQAEDWPDQAESETINVVAKEIVQDAITRIREPASADVTEITVSAWGDPVRYLTDDRDSRNRHELVIQQGGNGDWYVSVVPEGKNSFHGVRLCTSGGASRACPGLCVAIANAYRAMRGEPVEKNLAEAECYLQEEDPPIDHDINIFSCVCGKCYEALANERDAANEKLVNAVSRILPAKQEDHHAIQDVCDAFECNYETGRQLLIAAMRKFPGLGVVITDPALLQIPSAS